MTPASPDLPIDVNPFFINTRNGDIFALQFLAHDTSPNEYLLIIPPFAEEMNKCRRMMTQLARRLAEQGTGILLIDLSGTGESWGDFSDARYNLWLNDLTSAHDWIVAQNAQLTSILGIRFGALPALQFARDCESCRHIILWQPAVSGKLVMSQFLRLRIAANMMAKDGAGESIASLTTVFAKGESVEIAGYEVAAELFQTIDKLRLVQLVPRNGQHISWFQITLIDDAAITPACQRAIDQLTRQGAEIDARCLRGDAFWSTAEITTCTPLLDATVAVLANHHA